ncbi:hypothetical protein A2642_01385 [Candidatus Nomurabacteria bacterium RIFCSPHIGHO2_01_FULL_39_10]|uniref:YdbS-like PH domain-containing protein n=1 Tax=Candidatus Nomurabacteria bacterium RIFCSPHIGHO2_01_FULL_39_10 TaxID=1801733 RepID=A0A1F6V9U9_9BACT|nr:MAG: hypothetical protein A2642_01385 [Candidatus Nomurabacteria bacterium RIFCSPHIGHO2_01_FULL_39_10]
MSSEKEEKVLYKLRKSRKAYLTEYICGGLLFVGAVVLFFMSFAGPVYILEGMAILGIFAIVSAEISRLMTRYIILPTKIIITKGIVQQTRQNVYFRPLGFATDINLRQGRLQRLLGYGTIYLRGSDAENAFELADIDYPEDMMRTLEELIEQNRGDNDKEEKRKS